ncbi:MAG: phosphate/phosphite/phosphonate ABC transporter substrate-binding protein [Anaerolineales bacterium]|nr:phosphate/phosphite/phosphonate ABC transporter substrate-binding protein [Anaerolineales bacterium]
MRKKRLYIFIALGVLLIAALALGGCARQAELGTEENPLIWVFVPSGEVDRVTAGGESMADLIFKETGLVVDIFVATDNTSAIEAMCSDPPKAHMGSLNTFSYIQAADRGCAEAALVSVRFGSPTYNGQIFVHADSGYNEISELNGLTFCRDDAFSTSSWIIPSIELAAVGVEVTPKDAGSHDAAVAGVYEGECDAGASYVDARSRIEEEHPDVMEVVKVIFQTTDIPNDGVQYVPSLSDELRTQLTDAFLAMAATEEGLEAMDTAYQWAGLEAHGDSFYDPFRQLLDAAGISAADIE